MFGIYRMFNDGTRLHHVVNISNEEDARTTARVLDSAYSNANHVVINLGSPAVPAEPPVVEPEPEPVDEVGDTEDLWRLFRDSLKEESRFSREDGEEYEGFLGVHEVEDGFEVVIGDGKDNLKTLLSLEKAAELCYNLSRAVQVKAMRRRFGGL